MPQIDPIWSLSRGDPAGISKYWVIEKDIRKSAKTESFNLRKMVFGNYNAWRIHPMASPNLYQAFPGFKWAVGIFAIYCSGEWV